MYGKVIKFDYDFVTSREAYGITVAPCLTNGERYILLTMLDYIGWATRWVSFTGQSISQDAIDGWRDSIAAKLSTGGCEVDCDDVIACIITALDGEGTDLQQAIADWLREHQNEIPDYPDIEGEPTSLISENLNNNGCDGDTVYGFCLQLVQFINRQIEDLLDRIETWMNGVELVGVFGDSVPSLTELTDLMVYIQETLKENYLSNYDQELEEQIACDLLCLMSDNDNCTLTWDELVTYFSLQCAYEMTTFSLADWAAFVFNGTWSGDAFVYVFYMTFAMVLAQGGTWTGVSLEFVQRTIETFFNDPDSDWETLCTDCVWEYTHDFTTSDGGWELASDFSAVYQGQYIAGTGWRITAQDNAEGGGYDWSRAVCIGYPMIDGAKIHQINFTYDYVNSGNWDGTGNTHHIVETHTDESESYEYTYVSAETDTNGTGKILGWLGIHPTKAGQLKVRFLSGRLFTNSDPGGNVVITSVLIRGRGPNPFE